MARKLKIKLGDTVEVITGSDKGKRGTVLDLNSNKLQIKVQGARIQTHFSREDGKTEKEGFMDYSNVKLVEAKKSTGKKKKTASK